jgi:hypothetical protein
MMTIFYSATKPPEILPPVIPVPLEWSLVKSQVPPPWKIFLGEETDVKYHHPQPSKTNRHPRGRRARPYRQAIEKAERTGCEILSTPQQIFVFFAHSTNRQESLKKKAVQPPRDEQKKSITLHQYAICVCTGCDSRASVWTAYVI